MLSDRFARFDTDGAPQDAEAELTFTVYCYIFSVVLGWSLRALHVHTLYSRPTLSSEFARFDTDRASQEADSELTFSVLLHVSVVLFFALWAFHVQTLSLRQTLYSGCSRIDSLDSTLTELDKKQKKVSSLSLHRYMFSVVLAWSLWAFHVHTLLVGRLCPRNSLDSTQTELHKMQKVSSLDLPLPLSL